MHNLGKNIAYLAVDLYINLSKLHGKCNICLLMSLVVFIQRLIVIRSNASQAAFA